MVSSGSAAISSRSVLRLGDLIRTATCISQPNSSPPVRQRSKIRRGLRSAQVAERAIPHRYLTLTFTMVLLQTVPLACADDEVSYTDGRSETLPIHTVAAGRSQ